LCSLVLFKVCLSARLTGGNRLFNVLTLTGTPVFRSQHSASDYGNWHKSRAGPDWPGQKLGTWEHGYVGHMSLVAGDVLEIGKTNHFAISQLVRDGGDVNGAD